jgi:phosphoglycerate dehydrogenase-like enzyme
MTTTDGGFGLKRVAILDDYQGVALTLGPWDRLAGRVELTVLREHVGDRDRLAELLAPFDVIVANRERTTIDEALVQRLPRLRLLATSGMRNSAIDMEALAAAGVTVCGTETLGYPTVELTWALILGHARHIVEGANSMRGGGWQTRVGVGVQGKVLGVVGMGRLGKAVARVGVALGMKVIGWSRSLTPEQAAAVGAEAVSFATLLQQSDVLTLHVPLNAQTHHLIGEPEFAAMKPGALLVNTARGPVVDEAALIRAIEQGRLGGAALDVYDQEPLPADHPLRRLDKVLLSPHVGYVIEENYRVAFAQIVENIESWLDGHPTRVVKAPATTPPT